MYTRLEVYYAAGSCHNSLSILRACGVSGAGRGHAARLHVTRALLAMLRHTCCCCAGGVYAVLVRRQLQSAAHDSSGSLASIGEDTVVENGSLQRAASEDPNADLLRRQSTGAGLRNAVCVSVVHACPLLCTIDVALDSRHAARPLHASSGYPKDCSSL